MKWFKRAGIVACAALLLASSQASWAETVEWIGNRFRVTWAPATGTLDGYQVHVSRAGLEFVEEQRTPETTAVIEGEIGQAIIVKVRAYRGDYDGPFSEPSDTILLSTDAPGAFTIGCPEADETLVQLGPNKFVCVKSQAGGGPQ